jgi:hypothetical protein
MAGLLAVFAGVEREILHEHASVADSFLLLFFDCSLSLSPLFPNIIHVPKWNCIH